VQSELGGSESYGFASIEGNPGKVSRAYQTMPTTIYTTRTTITVNRITIQGK
jgi:hypothetical protein